MRNNSIAKYQKTTVESTFFDGSVLSVDKNTENEHLSAGLGYRKSMSNTADFFSAVTYEKIERTSGEFSSSNTGYGMSAGIRSMFSNNLEFSAEYVYLTIEDDTDNLVSVTALYGFSDKLSIGVTYVMADESDTSKASLRYAF